MKGKKYVNISEYVENFKEICELNFYSYISGPFLIQDIRASVDFFLSIQTQEVGPYNHDTCLLYLLFQYLK
jgi:hypothetical protein